jgi:TAP-like protein
LTRQVLPIDQGTTSSVAIVFRAPTLAEFQQLADANAAFFPVPHAATGVGDCAGWPSAATNPPHTLQVGSHPNVMVANATHDPPTPLISALVVGRRYQMRGC